MTKRVTIQDLATELNTTPSTISRALRDHPAISTAMKKKVLSLAKKRNYQVNAMASALRVGTSKTIGVIVPRINRDFFAQVISGVEDVAYHNEYNVMICQTHDEVKREKQYVNALIRSRAAGILVSVGLETDSFEHFEEVKRLGIPLIFFDRVSEQTNINKIQNNDRVGAYKAVSHLLDNGYKRIAHFAGPDYLNVYKDRKAGYIEALKDRGVEIDESLIIHHNLKAEDGRRDIQKLLKLKNPPDALFSASDYSALGALLYLNENGYKVPKEMGIVGYSNEKFTALTSPGLTSVDQHGTDIGQYAAKVFLEEINNKGEKLLPRTIVLDPMLIVRGSSSKNK